MIRLGLGLCDGTGPDALGNPPAPPLQAAPLDPVTVTAGTGLATAALAEAFTGDGLVFSLPVPRTGLSLHSLSGQLEIDTGATGFVEAEPVTIRVANAGGVLEADLSLSVDPQDAVFVSVQGLTNNPTHGPTAEIGSTLSVVVPAYSGGLLYQWYTDEGGDLPGATLATLVVPDTIDTLTLGCRVTADFALPQPVAVATVRQVPAGAGVIDPTVLGLSGGIETVSVAAGFSGAALTYALSAPPAGVSIAAATGLVSVDTAVTGSFAPLDITVTASNSGGSASAVLSLSVAAIPVNQGLPGISGLPEIGATLTATPGSWSGEESLAYQWLRDGAEIAGATAASLTLSAADDGQAISLRETATNASGSSSAVSAAVTALYAPPVALGFGDQTLLSGPSSQTIDVSAAFSGGGLRFSSSDDELFPIDPDTGIIDVDTSGALAGTSVTITASNSGGFDDVTFTITVGQSVNESMSFDGNDGWRQTYPGPSGMPASLDATGFWLSCVYYYDGSTAPIDNASLLSIADANTGTRYMAMTATQAVVRNTSSTFTSSTVPDAPGWVRVTARFFVNGGGDTEIWHKVEALSAKTNTRGSTGELAAIVAATPRFGLGYNADNSPTYFDGKAFDFACGTGDPAAFHDAMVAGSDITGKVASAYDFDADATCSILANWLCAQVSDEDSATALADVDDLIGAFDSWTKVGDATWSSHIPFQVPPFPQWTTDPAISRSGDTITIVPGVASGAPTPTVTNTLYWNGVDVTGDMVGNTYTKTGKGQAVLVSLAEAPEGYIDEVLDLWDEDTQPSAASNMNTYEMAGVAYNGVYVQFSGAVSVGRYLRSAFDNAFLCAPVICESSVSVTGHFPAFQTLASGRKVNGAMKNVAVRKGSNSNPIQGWDSLHQTYTDGLNEAASYPVTLDAGDTLLIGISNIRSTSKKRQLDRYGIVQVNPAGTTLPTADAIPPMPYHYGMNANKPMRRWADVTGSLPGLDYSGVTETPPTLTDSLMRPVIDPITNWGREFTQTGGTHIRTYGRDYENAYKDELAYLMGDDVDSDKDLMLVALVRNGAWSYDAFTRYTATNPDVPWQPDGGHNHARKTLIVFAGHMLGDTDMRDVVTQTNTSSQTGGLQEDVMTAYVTQSLLDIVAAGQGNGWSPQYSSSGVAPYTSGMYNGGTYPMPDWRGKASESNMNAHGSAHPYRNTGNHQVHFASVLAMLACGLKTAWGHDAYFDHQIRHWKIKTGEADPWIARGGSTPGSYSQPAGWATSSYSGYAYDAFTDQIAGLYTYPWGGAP